MVQAVNKLPPRNILEERKGDIRIREKKEKIYKSCSSVEYSSTEEETDGELFWKKGVGECSKLWASSSGPNKEGAISSGLRKEGLILDKPTQLSGPKEVVSEVAIISETEAQHQEVGRTNSTSNECEYSVEKNSEHRRNSFQGIELWIDLRNQDSKDNDNVLEGRKVGTEKEATQETFVAETQFEDVRGNQFTVARKPRKGEQRINHKTHPMKTRGFKKVTWHLGDEIAKAIKKRSSNGDRFKVSETEH
ncbi:hypothetical protein Q3G72_011286 [Acer saccharum]|nr:hypothetical protein Q3G72_011286 [Acer saccharum]